MINSIQQFQENGIGKIEKVTSKFLENPSNIAEYVQGITDNMVELRLSLIKEGFEDVDEYIRKTPNRRKNWVIVRKDEVQLLTSLGTVKYKKTLFKNKIDGHCEYLPDKLMNLGAHERISEDALAGLLEEATQTSYTKSGNVVSISESVEGEIPGDVTKQFESSKKFLLRNFKYIKNGINYKNHLCGCSAEGYVSHILSNRLSSRPMGWSKTGVDKVSKLRAFKANGGDFLQPVRYQKQNNILKIQEKEEIGMRELRKSFENKVSESKKYIDRFSASIASRQIKKILYLHQSQKIELLFQN